MAVVEVEAAVLREKNIQLNNFFFFIRPRRVNAFNVPNRHSFIFFVIIILPFISRCPVFTRHKA